MKAVVAHEPLPVDDPRCLADAELPDPPAPTGRDLLVRVEAVSVNPLDAKQRLARGPHGGAAAGPRVLGWDAAGTVVATGEGCTLFRPGDAVYYAGSIIRPGCNAGLHLVDERITGRRPASIDAAAAAALPLTSITAYEALVDRMGVDASGKSRGRSLLVIGGAGGVGSMAIQIGRELGLDVIATASRQESADWCRSLGAVATIDHRPPLKDGLRAAGRKDVDYILNCVDTDRYWTQMADVIAPQGSIASIVVAEAAVDLRLLMRKCARFAWEAMFTRAIYGTPDMIEQHRLLNRVAAWVDAGVVRSTMRDRLPHIDAANLREAHRRLETRTTIGKVVLGGWG